MATPFAPRTMKQRLADTRLTIRRGPTAVADSPSRDPFEPSHPDTRPVTPPSQKFRAKSPSFKPSGRGKPRGGMPSF